MACLPRQQQLILFESNLINIGIFMIMEKQESYSIFTIGIMQIVFALYLFYVIYLQFCFESRIIVIIALSFYSIHLFVSATSLLRLKHPGRILSITNMLGLSIVSIGGMFWVGINRFMHFALWFMILCISIYSVYLLTRPNIKSRFE